MPKILSVINRLNLGGPTYNVAYLAKYMEPDYETLVVSGMLDEGETSSEQILVEMGITPKYIKDMHRSIRPLSDYRGYKEMREIIRHFKPDIVHTHSSKAGVLGRLAAAHENVPAIVHTFHGHVFHSYFNPIVTRVFIEIERYLAKISHSIVAISPLQKKELSDEFKICPTNKIAVVHNGFDLDRFNVDNANRRQIFREKYALMENEVAIGLVGRIVPIKNHLYFLEVIKSIIDKGHKNVRGIIIGDGPDRTSLENQAKEMGLSVSTPETENKNANIIFTSWIHKIEFALPGLDIMALTSLNEGTPASLVEAQAASLPVISTNVGGVSDVIDENVSGFLAPANQPNVFVEKLIPLLNDEGLRKEMGKIGKQFVIDRFSYKTLVKNMDALYRTILPAKYYL